MDDSDSSDNSYHPSDDPSDLDNYDLDDDFIDDSDAEEDSEYTTTTCESEDNDDHEESNNVNELPADRAPQTEMQTDGPSVPNNVIFDEEMEITTDTTAPLPINDDAPVASTSLIESTSNVPPSFSQSSPEDDEEGQICSICLEPWTNSGDHRIATTPCGHLFGYICIEKWLKGQGHNRCPQCNAKVKKSQLTNIYAPCVKAIDTSERDRALKELEKEREERRKIELVLAQERLKHQLAVKELEDFKRNSAVVKTTLGSPTKLIKSEVKPVANLRFIEEKSIEVNKNGGCRIMACSDILGMLVTTVPSNVPVFPGYGVKKFRTLDFRCGEYISIHSQVIRDAAFHPTRGDGLLLTGSLDKTMKITNVLTNATVQTYYLDSPVWSCCWHHDSPYHFFAGCQSGKTYLFDTRNTASYVHHITPDKHGPVVSLQYINNSNTNSFSIGGVLIGQLNSCTFYEYISDTLLQPHALPVEGSLTSVSFELSSRLIMTSARPSGSCPYVKHTVFEPSFEPKNEVDGTPGHLFACNPIYTFNGGNTQKLLSRSRLIKHPFNSKSVLACAGDESALCTMVWDLSTAQCIGKLQDASVILDICQIQNRAPFRFSTLSEKTLKIYKLIE